MQFVKKNYEKIVLGLILFGLLVAVGSLPFLVANEKDKLKAFSERIQVRTPKALPAPDLSASEALLKQAATTVNLVFSDDEHKLLNPVRWQRRGNDAPFKNPQGTEIRKLVMMWPTN